jgi:hypothetical protein
MAGFESCVFVSYRYVTYKIVANIHILRRTIIVKTPAPTLRVLGVLLLTSLPQLPSALAVMCNSEAASYHRHKISMLSEHPSHNSIHLRA